MQKHTSKIHHAASEQFLQPCVLLSATTAAMLVLDSTEHLAVKYLYYSFRLCVFILSLNKT